MSMFDVVILHSSQILEWNVEYQHATEDIPDLKLINLDRQFLFKSKMLEQMCDMIKGNESGVFLQCWKKKKCSNFCFFISFCINFLTHSSSWVFWIHLFLFLYILFLIIFSSWYFVHNSVTTCPIWIWFASKCSIILKLTEYKHLNSLTCNTLPFSVSHILDVLDRVEANLLPKE